MFNCYIYQKNKLLELENKNELLKFKQDQEKSRVKREKLYENYSKRISEFILHMGDQPIKINTYQIPIENPGRLTDPNKFKGKSSMLQSD